MKVLDNKELEIFLSAMRREEEVCTRLDDEEFGGIKLVPICKSIKRKVNDAVPKKAIEEVLKDAYAVLVKAELKGEGCQEVIEIIDSIHKHTGGKL